MHAGPVRQDAKDPFEPFWFSLANQQAVVLCCCIVRCVKEHARILCATSIQGGSIIPIIGDSI